MGRPTVPTALAVCALVAALVLSACGGDEAHELTGAVREPAPFVGDVSLPQANGGEDLAFVAPDGGLLIVYFGYTHCPDVCPTTMADLSLALDQLGDDAARVDVAMATVDPGRDTAEVITGYAMSFVDRAKALRTEDAAQLRAAADAFGVQYLVEESDDGEIEVGHSTSLYAVDSRGELVLTWPFGATVDDMAADMSALLEQR